MNHLKPPRMLVEEGSFDVSACWTTVRICQPPELWPRWLLRGGFDDAFPGAGSKIVQAVPTILIGWKDWRQNQGNRLNCGTTFLQRHLSTSPCQRRKFHIFCR